MIRGLALDAGVPVDQLAALVTRAVLADRVPVAAAKVPAMLAFKVRHFCAHNVALREHCDACALAGAIDGLRVFSFVMPVTVRQVYVRRDADSPQQGDADVGTDRGGSGDAGDAGAGTVGYPGSANGQ